MSTNNTNLKSELEVNRGPRPQLIRQNVALLKTDRKTIGNKTSIQLYLDNHSVTILNTFLQMTVIQMVPLSNSQST